MVAKTHRRQRLTRRLLEQEKWIANQRNCCKITLEVLEGNQQARTIYQTFGFLTDQTDEAPGKSIFCEKNLSR